MNIKVHKIELEQAYGCIYANKRVGYNIIIANDLDPKVEEEIIKEQTKYIEMNKPKYLSRLINYNGKLLR